MRINWNLNFFSGGAIIVYWKEVSSQLYQTPQRRDIMEFTGETQQYHGEMQIKVRNGDSAGEFTFSIPENQLYRVMEQAVSR